MIDYAAILKGDTGQPGLLNAVQSRAARRDLHTQLSGMLAPGCRAGRLELTRVKYKPGRRLSAYYTTQAGSLGQERTVPFVITWSSAPDGTEPDGVRQMEEESARRGLLAPFQRLRSVDARHGGLMEVWPLDPEFPQLPRLGDPTYTGDLFRAAGVPLPSECIKVTPVRYRPGERHVLRYQVETSGAPRLVYAKLYREPEEAARAARIAGRASDWLDAHLEGFHGVRPEGVCLEDGVILYPHAAGLPLSQQLRRSPEWLNRQFRLVGAALQTLHRGPQSLVEELEENTLEKEVKVIRRASEHVQVLLPEAGRRILALLDRAQAQHARLPQESPTFTHSDFKADHLLVGREGMSLIDFDTCALADPALDVGKFLADLEWWHTITQTPGVEQAQQAFLEGYGGTDVDGRMARARIYHALILTKIAIRRARLYWKDWEALTTQMVVRAEAIVGR